MGDKSSTRRRDIQLAEEPWLHRVLIVRSRLEPVALSERVDMVTTTSSAREAVVSTTCLAGENRTTGTEPPDDTASPNMAHFRKLELNRGVGSSARVCSIDPETRELFPRGFQATRNGICAARPRSVRVTWR